MALIVAKTLRLCYLHHSSAFIYYQPSISTIFSYFLRHFTLSFRLPLLQFIHTETNSRTHLPFFLQSLLSFVPFLWFSLSLSFSCSHSINLNPRGFASNQVLAITSYRFDSRSHTRTFLSFLNSRVPLGAPVVSKRRSHPSIEKRAQAALFGRFVTRSTPNSAFRFSPIRPWCRNDRRKEGTFWPVPLVLRFPFFALARSITNWTSEITGEGERIEEEKRRTRSRVTARSWPSCSREMDRQIGRQRGTTFLSSTDEETSSPVSRNESERPRRGRGTTWNESSRL